MLESIKQSTFAYFCTECVLAGNRPIYVGIAYSFRYCLFMQVLPNYVGICIIAQKNLRINDLELPCEIGRWTPLHCAAFIKKFSLSLCFGLVFSHENLAEKNLSNVTWKCKFDSHHHSSADNHLDYYYFQTCLLSKS